MSLYQVKQFIRRSHRSRSDQIRPHGTQILYPLVYNFDAVKPRRSYNLLEKMRPLPPAFDEHKV